MLLEGERTLLLPLLLLLLVALGGMARTGSVCVFCMVGWTMAEDDTEAADDVAVDVEAGAVVVTAAAAAGWWRLRGGVRIVLDEDWKEEGAGWFWSRERGEVSD